VPLPYVITPHVVWPIVSLIGGAVLILLGAFVARVPDLDLRVGLPHRGVTHSLVAAAVATALVCGLVSALMPQDAVVVAAVTGCAYLSHLAADGFNPMPQAVLWPMPRYRPRWLPSVREDSLSAQTDREVQRLAALAAAWAVARGRPDRNSGGLVDHSTPRHLPRPDPFRTERQGCRRRSLIDNQPSC
jgi:hypothetical protein